MDAEERNLRRLAKKRPKRTYRDAISGPEFWERWYRGVMIARERYILGVQDTYRKATGKEPPDLG